MELSQILGWIATILFSIMIIPQMIKTFKSKSIDNVSLSLFIVYLFANFVALAYALLIAQSPLIIKYSIAIVTTMLYIVLYVYYYKKG